MNYPNRGRPPSPPTSPKPVPALAGAAALAALLALSLPAIGQSAPPSPPADLGQEARLSEGRPFISFPWGSGPGEVGLFRPLEGLARGPEAFAVSPSGRVAVLDSVNRRLLLAGPEQSVPPSAALDLGDPRFLAASDDAVYVLEEGEGRLQGYDWSGKPTVDLSFTPFGEPVSGLFLRKERLFVELLHDQVFELRVKGRGSAEAVKVNGRPADPSGDRQVQASFARDRSAKIRTVEPGGEAQESQVAFSREVEHLVSLDGDGAGRLALGVRLLQDPEAPAGEPDVLVTRLPSAGQPPAAILLDEGASIAYVGEPYRYGADGRVYQPLAEDAGFTILVHDLPGGSR